MTYMYCNVYIDSVKRRNAFPMTVLMRSCDVLTRSCDVLTRSWDD